MNNEVPTKIMKKHTYTINLPDYNLPSLSIHLLEMAQFQSQF